MREIYWFKLKKSGIYLPAGRQVWSPDTFECYMLTYLYVFLQIWLTIIFIQRLGSPIIPILTSIIMYIFLSGVLLGLLLIACLLKGEPWGKKNN
jgi:hypothetical protein